MAHCTSEPSCSTLEVTFVRESTILLPLPAEEDELEDELPQNSSGNGAPEAQKRPILSVFCGGGAEGGRTPDLLIANEALSQLSYGPATSSGTASSPRVRGVCI